MHNFAQNFSDCPLNLFVYATFNVALGVSDLLLPSLRVFENAAAAVIVELKEVFSVNKVAVTSVNVVGAFERPEMSSACSVFNED